MWDLGDDPAASAALKLIGNSWIVSQIEVASQCLALGEANGIEGVSRVVFCYVEEGGLVQLAELPARARQAGRAGQPNSLCAACATLPPVARPPPPSLQPGTS